MSEREMIQVGAIADARIHIAWMLQALAITGPKSMVRTYLVLHGT